MDDFNFNSNVLLKYSIYKYSSFSSKFAPENILDDKPQDQTSRWSSDSHVPPQFLIMKLEVPAIVTSIKFGKYEKSHVCNVKKLQVWGGLTEDNLLLLLDGGLKNDSVPESFPLKHSVANTPFPVRYIKLLPLQAWGSTFNFSLWHIALTGCPDPALVRRCIHTYTVHCEREALRVCLKHLRHKRYNSAYAALSRETNTRLEHPILTLLYKACTERDDTRQCEEILRRAAAGGLLTEYLRGQTLVPVWRQLLPPPGSAPHTTPGMRGGHQLCCDTSTIYLFGGWDGQQDLSDLWSYNIPNNEWTCISHDTKQQGGPSARSCHKLCLDAERRQLFTLGRYVDSKMRTPDNLKSDFYLYELETGRWTLITEDTAGVGGPRLIFDHQMVMDVQDRVIYVFGGRVLTQSRWEGVGLDTDRSGGVGSSFSPAEPQFSGLYRYHVATNTWTCLREDDAGTSSIRSTGTSSSSSVRLVGVTSSQAPPISNARSRQATPTNSTNLHSTSSPTLRSRVGHSMLFHPMSRQLFILAGQRNREYFTDFFTYQIDTDIVTSISDASSPSNGNGPSSGRGGASSNEGGASTGVGGTNSLTGPAGGVMGAAVAAMGSLNSAINTGTPGVTASGSNSEGGSLLGPGFPHRAGDVPTAGFTQKATIDPTLDEIHVFSCLSKEKEKRDMVSNLFWVYSIPLNKWTCIYHNEVSGDGPDGGDEPCPRFAHQLVYDHINKVHYMFGGNPGRHQQPKMRLDDFWCLQLCRPTPEKLLQEAVFVIRKNRYEELAVQDSVGALHYLQTELHGAVDHTNTDQVSEFQRLAGTLFQPADPELCHPPLLRMLEEPPLSVPEFSDMLPSSDASYSSAMDVHHTPLMEVGDSTTHHNDSATEQLEAWKHRRRSDLFNSLAKYFPESMTQPNTNLLDLVTL